MCHSTHVEDSFLGLLLFPSLCRYLELNSGCQAYPDSKHLYTLTPPILISSWQHGCFQFRSVPPHFLFIQKPSITTPKEATSFGILVARWEDVARIVQDHSKILPSLGESGCSPIPSSFKEHIALKQSRLSVLEGSLYTYHSQVQGSSSTYIFSFHVGLV